MPYTFCKDGAVLEVLLHTLYKNVYSVKGCVFCFDTHFRYTIYLDSCGMVFHKMETQSCLLFVSVPHLY